MVVVVLCSCSGLLTAQTKVVKRTAVKANDYGVAYALPKTNLIVSTEVIRTVQKRGEFYSYAGKYLGVKTVATEDRTWYQLGNTTLNNVGVVDEDARYVISFKAKTTAPYAFLTEEGLLCTINAPHTPKASSDSDSDATKAAPKKTSSASVFSEELLMAGSMAKQAEVAAKQIYRIRESKLNILTGEADNLPPDGQAMKIVIDELEAQERTLTALFLGTTVSDTTYYDVAIEPTEEFERKVLFRFSRHLGVVDADDLSGAPIYASLVCTERPEPIADEKERAKREKMSRDGIVYNHPGRGRLTLELNGRTILEQESAVTQFGVKELLAPVLFEDRDAPVKVFFYPETGAIKQIIQ